MSGFEGTSKMFTKTAATLLTFGFFLGQFPVMGGQPFSSLLGQQARASSNDLKLYNNSGGVFAKILPHVRKGEIAAAGAVQISVTIDFFIARIRGIEAFKKGPAVLSIDKFSDPPREQDLRKLDLGKKELDSLAGCRPGRCPLKLSSEMMNRLPRTAATLGPGPKLESEFRAALLNYVSSYVEKGAPAMMTYCDTDPPVQTGREFLAVLGQFVWLEKYAPLLFEALRDPRAARPEIDDFLYWSKESFGLKPVVSVTHVLIFKTMVGGKQWAFIASKQIYANHYFDTSLGLTVLAEESADPAHARISVAYFNRSQTDGLRGWFASIERSIVEGRVRASLLKNLAGMRDRLGKAYQDELAINGRRPSTAR
jgi:hypothetical protein